MVRKSGKNRNFHIVSSDTALLGFLLQIESVQLALSENYSDGEIFNFHHLQKHRHFPDEIISDTSLTKLSPISYTIRFVFQDKSEDKSLKINRIVKARL